MYNLKSSKNNEKFLSFGKQMAWIKFKLKNLSKRNKFFNFVRTNKIFKRKKNSKNNS